MLLPIVLLELLGEYRMLDHEGFCHVSLVALPYLASGCLEQLARPFLRVGVRRASRSTQLS